MTPQTDQGVDKPKRQRFPIEVRNGSIVAKIYKVGRNYKGKDGRRHRREVFSVSFGAGTGRKVRQFGKLSSAKEQARRVVDQLAAGKPDASLLSKHDVEELALARTIAGDVPITNALRQWKKAQELVGEEMLAACEAWAQRRTKLEHILVADAIPRFIKDKQADGVDTGNSYEGVLSKFKARFGACFVDKIHVRDLNEWLKSVSVPATRNTYRKRIVTFFGWAKDQEYLPRELSTEASMTKAVDEPPPARAVITPATLTAWLDGCLLHRPEFIPAMVLSAFAGLRSKEVNLQVWEDINLVEGHLNVTAAKEGTPAYRLVPILPVLRTWLELTPKEERTGLVHGYDTQIMTLVRNYGRRELKLKLPSNCLRKTWVSCRVTVTKDLAATALEAGHTSQVAIRNYRGIVTEAAANAWFNIMPQHQRNLARLKAPAWLWKCDCAVFGGRAMFWPMQRHIRYLEILNLPVEEQTVAIAEFSGASRRRVAELREFRVRRIDAKIRAAAPISMEGKAS